MQCLLRSTQAKTVDTILEDGKEESIGWKLKQDVTSADSIKIVQMSANYAARSVRIKPIKASLPYEIRLNGKQLTWQADSEGEVGKEGDFIDINLGTEKGHLQFKICFEDTKSSNDRSCNNSSSCSASGNAIQRPKSTSPHRVPAKVRPCCQHKKQNKM